MGSHGGDDDVVGVGVSVLVTCVKKREVVEVRGLDCEDMRRGERLLLFGKVEEVILFADNSFVGVV